MLETQTEKTLINEVINGNERAFEQLLNDHKKKLKSSMLSKFKSLNEYDFEDCWQNATIKAYKKIGTFRADSSFKTWIFRILNNEAIMFLVKKQNQDKHELKLETLVEEIDGDNVSSYDLVSGVDHDLVENAYQIIEARERATEYKFIIDQALEKIDSNHAEILTKVLMDGKSYKEVADELNIPIGTVMSRMHYARKKVERLIKYYASVQHIQLPCSR